MTTADVAVIGGGVIGLATAWRAASTGLSVVVCDASPATGASWAAAGMLAPTTEARWGEVELHRLALESATQWAAFAEQLEAESGVAVGWRSEGTVTVAFDADDYRVLADDVDVQRRLGGQVELLSGRECRALEPALNPRIVGGTFSATDTQVDNRLVLKALMTVLERGTVLLERQAVVRLSPGGLKLADGTAVSADQVVLAAGCRSGQIEGLDPDDVPAVRPVKGQILRLGSDPSAPILTRTVRAVAQGRSVYLVPRHHGEVVVGATVEEKGFDVSVTAGAVYDLMRAATAAVPDIGELTFTEATARSRPGTPDNGPIIGPGSMEGLWLATGHYRHGILLTPITASAIAGGLTGGVLPDPVIPFSPDRFRRAVDQC